MKGLKRLEISRKYNNGTFDCSEIEKLSQIESLALRYNKVTELSSGICNLPQLKELCLYGNELTKLPPQVGDMEMLESLDIRETGIQEIDAQLLAKLDQIRDCKRYELRPVPTSTRFETLGNLFVNVAINFLPSLLLFGGKEPLVHAVIDRVTSNKQ